MKQRNPNWGCPRIAQQIALAFHIQIDKDVVRRILACAWRIVIVASFERNITMLHWRKPLNGIFGRHRYQGVPEGPPAITHENARNEEAVRSIAGSTVEKDWTLS